MRQTKQPSGRDKDGTRRPAGGRHARPSVERNRRAKQSAFLKGIRETGTLSGAARRSHSSRSSHYRWLQQDAEYAVDFANANEEATDALEQEARRRAFEGVEEPVFYKGERVGSIRKFSDSLLMLLLMAKRPDQFRERVDVTSKVDRGPFVIDPKIMKTLSDEELDIARRLARKISGLGEESSS